MRKIIILIVLVINGIILFYACKKDQSQEQLEYDTQTSQDNSLAEGTFNDVNNIAGEATETGSLSSYRLGNPHNLLLSNCATVTKTPDSLGGGTVVVDFGPNNCPCTDGRYRRGVINISYTGAYRDSGTQITITFNNYYVGKDSSYMFRVTGTKTVTNKGSNPAGHLNFDISVNGHLTNVNGITMDWESTRNREWTSGEITQDWTDDEYVITGNASGKNFEGNTFTVTITHGLHVEHCMYITEGTFDLTPTGKATRTFDYGDGTCDDKATVTVNGKSFPITLR